MGTVAIQVETRRPGVETALDRFLRRDMRAVGMPRQQGGAPVAVFQTPSRFCRAAGEVAPR